MNVCGEGCVPMCDFCEHYCPKNEFCELHHWEKDPDEGCDDFQCMLVEESDANL